MFLYQGKKFDPDMPRTIDGIQYPVGWFRDPANRAAIGATEVPDPVRPDDELYFVTENEDGSYTAVPRDPEQLKAALKRKLAEKRYDREIAGTVWGGYPVDTDRESQGKIIAAFVLAQGGLWPAGSPWKFKDGVFRSMEAADVIALAAAVQMHVQTCYGVESNKIAEIEANGTTDLETGWPT